MKIETRLVEAGDYANWAMLWQRYLEFYKSSRPEPVFRESWARIQDPDQPMYSALAFAGTRAVGLVNFLYHKSFWDIEERCYLNDLYVDPDQRGAGIGTRLIALARDHATAQGAAQLYWLTEAHNVTARKLYDRVGTLTPYIKYTCP